MNPVVLATVVTLQTPVDDNPENNGNDQNNDDVPQVFPDEHLVAANEVT